MRESNVSVSPANVPYFGGWSRERSSALPSGRIVIVSSLPFAPFWPRNVPIAQSPPLSPRYPRDGPYQELRPSVRG
jgi:hypothetical protein